MDAVGFIHGRFQPLHNDHMKYLLAGKSRCRHMVVGITNPDPLLTSHDPDDPVRSLDSANVLTYYQRLNMIRDALLEAQVSYEEFSIVPFPVNRPDLYRFYAPLDATFYLTIYDSWGHKKHKLFQSVGLKTEVMWEKPATEKGICGATVRNAMVHGDPWEHLVPASTARLLKEWRMPEMLAAWNRGA
ncbi:MAG: nicotinate-nucleotide adenylyltransferase [Thermodesulfobacteriota bacterium]